MYAAGGSFVLALVVASLLTPIVRHYALKLGAVDRPGGRRVNTQRIPRLGGIAVLLAFFAPLLVLFGTQSSVAGMFYADPRHVAGLAIGGFLIAALGLLDDLVGVRAWHKLAVQSIAALIAWYCGFRIGIVSLPWVGTIHLGWLGIPITLLWIVGIVNALNLIDGLDGLAAGIAFFACVANFTVATIHSNPLVMLLSATLAGSILGFLFYNFNPATIFMGDSGSMFLGFVLATMSLMGASMKGPTTIAILVPVLALGLPIMDMLFAMLRRILERRSIFSPDRGHIHHRLIDYGLTQRRAVIILYALTSLLTLGAITVALGRNWHTGLALLILTVAMVGLVRFVGYFEYLKIRRKQRERIRQRSTELLRSAVPAAMARISALERLEDLPKELESFARAAEMLRVELVLPEGFEGLASFQWLAEKDDLDPTINHRDYVKSSYPLSQVAGYARLKFSWISDDGEVSPQDDILLQLVSDSCAHLLGRHGNQPHAS